MKTNISTLVKSYIQDNKRFIDGNVADHLILTVQSEEFGYYFYLTDVEIEEYENGTEEYKEKTRSEIEGWINENYNLDIWEIL